MTNRLALFLLLAPVAACKCGTPVSGYTEGLISTPTSWDAGSINAQQTVDGGVMLNANGTYAVTFAGSMATVEGDAGTGVFRVRPYAQPTLPPGASMLLGLTFTPDKAGAFSDWVLVQSDNGTLPIQVFGVGLDACAKVGCSSTNAGCAGQCVEGTCQYPMGQACQDLPNCLSNGTCDSSGNCGGANDCVPKGVCDSGVLYVGDIATHPDGHGTCSEGSNGQPGQCSFNTATQVCDCACNTASDGTGQCAYNWVIDPTGPDGGFGSVWASQSGDVWASSAASPSTGNFAPQTIYERTGGRWTQQATIPYGSNPIAGSGGGASIALVGDGNGNLVGGYQCAELNSSNGCVDGGMWKLASGAQSYEPFNPQAFSNGCSSNANQALVYPVFLGSTAATLNADPCGPELTTEQGGEFQVVGGSQVHTQCSANGALWGLGLTDYYVAWGCGQPSGGIWHSDGHASTKEATFNPGDSASAMAGSSDTDIWAVGTQRWHYDGTTWTQQPGYADGDGGDTSLWAGANADYFASGNYPGLYHYTSGAWNRECFAPGYNQPTAGQVAGDGQANYYAATPLGIYKRQ